MSEARRSGNEHDESISLEALVSGELPRDPGPDPSGTSDQASSSPDFAGASEGSEGEDLAAIDALLASEDPSFADNFRDITDGGLDGGAEIDSIDIDPYLGTGAKSPVKRLLNFLRIYGSRSMRRLKTLGNVLIHRTIAAGYRAKDFVRYMLQEGFRVGIARIRAGISAWIARGRSAVEKFIRSSRTEQLTVVAIGVLGLGLVGVIALFFKGNFMPSLEVPFVAAFTEVADQVWSYTPEEGMEEFNSPLRHPEHVVLLDKVVVNLRGGRTDGGNPMGMFEFYIEAATAETAVEINDRQKEILDVVQRTAESFVYDEIVTLEGKMQLKLRLRNEINRHLTKGHVRKVLFKSVVIKP